MIEEQQQWLRDRFPGRDLPYLFPQRRANAHAAKPYGNTNYGRSLALFSELAQITDAAGHPVKLSHTHRFRHTKFTKLAELGLPVHVLQRYAGHSTPTMSMHYVARRDEHAEQAFLATRKFRADGTRVSFSREDHDALHLLDRADRFLPNGYCLLPPLQKCEKGNACLTCSVFVTDDTHLAVLQRQLGPTAELIERTTAQFLERHGHPMPDGNVWLVEREAERDALARLLAAMQASPGRAIQGAGSPRRPGPRVHRPRPPPEAAAMTDSRQHRVDTLRQAARRKSEAKTKAAEAAIRTLVKRGEPITFQSVQREAGVSHAFLYGNQRKRVCVKRLAEIFVLIAVRALTWVILATRGAGVRCRPTVRRAVAWLRAWGRSAPGEGLMRRGPGARYPGLLALRSASGLGLAAWCTGRPAPTAFNRAGEKLRATGGELPRVSGGVSPRRRGGLALPLIGRKVSGTRGGCGRDLGAGQAASGWQRGACWQEAAPAATAGSQLVPWTIME